MTADAPADPGSLAEPDVRAARRALLQGPHIAPLTELIDQIRTETGFGDAVPYIDPLDGGVDARALLILESPGAKAVGSGFISRDNPDETARNAFELYREAGLDRAETVIWNIVPWYIRDRPGGSAPKWEDIQAGTVWLGKLLRLLPKLEVIVFIGKKAQKADRFIGKACPDVRQFRCALPSPNFINRSPGNREMILTVLRAVARELDGA